MAGRVFDLRQKIELQRRIGPAIFNLRLDSHYDDLRSYILCL